MELALQFEQFKQLIRDGDLEQVTRVASSQPDLLHMQDLAPDHWEERTALHCAARYAQLEIVKWLVSQGVEVYSHPFNSYPAVFIANQFRFFPDRPNAQAIVDYFLHEIPDKAEGTMGTGATIHIAARLGFTEVVQRHLELDPLAVHQRGWLGDTPLHWASHNGHVRIVKMLLDAGADIEADEMNCYGGKPLHWASEHEEAVVELLLERGAQVDSRNNYRPSDFFGMTPLLMNATQRDDCAAVTRLLLEAGADANITHQGQTAAEIARDQGNQQILDTLLGFEPTDQSAVVREPYLPALPRRPADGHKGTFGSVLVVAGSAGMSGAASLTGQAALHSGAGLVTVATPRCAGPIVAAAHPSYMTLSLDEDSSGRVVPDATRVLDRSLQFQSALAVGPGLGQSAGVSSVVRHLFDQADLPLVLDADGLNVFAGEPSQLARRSSSAPRVLTPHPGEFARLTGLETAHIAEHRERLASEFASSYDVVLVLKGQGTVVTDGSRVSVNTSGSTALSTGGSGDVLTGIIAALMGQGMDAWEAARCGVHLHGLAGEAASQIYGDRFTTSTEIIQQLSEALRRYPA